MLGSYFPQGIKQVLKLFTVDEAECMEIFPAGGGVQVEAMFKRFQTDVDEPNRQGGFSGIQSTIKPAVSVMLWPDQSDRALQ